MRAVSQGQWRRHSFVIQPEWFWSGGSVEYDWRVMILSITITYVNRFSGF
jgi:hypothetical protein